jgi:GDPmannose 4,6-dehydratase
LSAKRDWGHAKDYIEAMYLILQQPKPEDYVIATGITTEVREFVRMAFAEVGIEIEFRGKDQDEKGFVKKCNDPEYNLEIGKNVIAVDKRYYRPTEVDLLIGDATKARTKLGWKPKYDLPALIKDMVSSDLKLMKQERYLRDGGYNTMNYFE